MSKGMFNTTRIVQLEKKVKQIELDIDSIKERIRELERILKEKK